MLPTARLWRGCRFRATHASEGRGDRKQHNIALRVHRLHSKTQIVPARYRSFRSERRENRSIGKNGPTFLRLGCEEEEGFAHYYEHGCEKKKGTALLLLQILGGLRTRGAFTSLLRRKQPPSGTGVWGIPEMRCVDAGRKLGRRWKFLSFMYAISMLNSDTE